MTGPDPLPGIGDDGSPLPTVGAADGPADAPTTSGGEGGGVWARLTRRRTPNAQPHARARTCAREDAATPTPRGEDRGPWEGRPPSLAAITAYTVAGGWMPGEQPAWMEHLGRVYGLAVVVPVTAALYAAAWVLQRWSRTTAAVALAAPLWWWLR